MPVYPRRKGVRAYDTPAIADFWSQCAFHRPRPCRPHRRHRATTDICHPNPHKTHTDCRPPPPARTRAPSPRTAQAPRSQIARRAAPPPVFPVLTAHHTRSAEITPPKVRKNRSFSCRHPIHDEFSRKSAAFPLKSVTISSQALQHPQYLLFQPGDDELFQS